MSSVQVTSVSGLTNLESNKTLQVDGHNQSSPNLSPEHDSVKSDDENDKKGMVYSIIFPHQSYWS